MLHNKWFLWLESEPDLVGASIQGLTEQQSRCQPGWISFRSLTAEESASQLIQVAGIIHFPEAIYMTECMTEVSLLFGGYQLPSDSSGFPQFHATWASPVWLLSSSNLLESVWLQPAETELSYRTWSWEWHPITFAVFCQKQVTGPFYTQGRGLHKGIKTRKYTIEDYFMVSIPQSLSLICKIVIKIPTPKGGYTDSKRDNIHQVFARCLALVNSLTYEEFPFLNFSLSKNSIKSDIYVIWRGRQ